MDDAFNAEPVQDATSQAEWATRAQRVLPAGGFGNFDPSMIIRKGRGARVWDADGAEYVDLLIGSGPMLVGHGHPEVVEAAERQIREGMTFFANNPQGVALAEAIVDAVACAEQVRFVSAGGEADMYAMRLARAHTGRRRILKFEGGYHGMSGEALMSLAPTRLENFPQAVPDSAGIPDSVRAEVLIAPFNDIAATRQILDEYGHEIACVIVEPLQRIVPPEPGFLAALREETARRGIVLIFDEVVTGFRLAYGGAQERYGVVPDVCALGKIIGGGFPLAAIAGRTDLMAHFDKGLVGEDGFLYQIGTLSGNPVASAAGLKTMEILHRPGAFDRLIANGERLMAATRAALTEAGAPFQIVGDPTLFEVVFTDQRVVDYRGVLRGDADLARRYQKGLRRGGVFKSDGKTYPSLALTEDDFELVEAAIKSSAQAL